MNRRLECEVDLLHASVCQALADPKRILILYELAQGSRAVNDLAEALRVPQPTVSRHLKVLRERSLVVAERDGVSIRYRSSTVASSMRSTPCAPFSLVPSPAKLSSWARRDEEHHHRSRLG